MPDPGKNAPMGPCKLCTTVGPLIDSHVIPQWAYRRVTQTADPRYKIPVQVRDGLAMFKSDQLKDYLMCRPCEDRFGEWEKYVAEVTWKDGAFPLRDEALAHIVGGYADLRVGDISACDVESLSKFGASVLWRAAVVPHLLKNMSLGPYFDSFRRYLLRDAPFPQNARMLLHVLGPDVPQITQLISPPSRGRFFPGYHYFHFILFGLSFEFYVGAGNLAPFDAGHLPITSKALVVDGHRQIAAIARTAFGAKPVGAFAKHVSDRDEDKPTTQHSFPRGRSKG